MMVSFPSANSNSATMEFNDRGVTVQGVLTKLKEPDIWVMNMLGVMKPFPPVKIVMGRDSITISDPDGRNARVFNEIF